MDFISGLRGMTLGEVSRAVIQEGGAVTGGLFVAGALGRRIENALVKVPVSPASTTMEKAKGWAANNVPKLALWWFLRGRPGAITDDLKKGAVSSVFFDTVMRLTNSGVNPATATIMGFQVLGQEGLMSTGDVATVQKLIQENSQLRAELNNMMQRMATGQPGIKVQQVPYSGVQETPYSPRLPPYVGSQQVIPPEARERKYGFMQPNIPGVPRPPGTAERERRFGFAGTNISSASARPGSPRAADIEVGKMFGMY